MSRKKGMSHAEIAEELKISVRSVENQIYRTLVILKTELKDYLIVLLIAFITLLHYLPFISTSATTGM